MKQISNPLISLLTSLLILCLSSNAGAASSAAVVCPTIVVSPVQTTICMGQSVTLTASGGVNYTWTQSGSGPQYTSVIVVSPTNSAFYKVVTDDGLGCKDSAQVIVVVNPIPNISVVSSKTLVCVGAPSTLIAGPAGNNNSYQWSSNAGGAQTNTVIVTPTVATVYQVTVTNNSTGCSASKSIQVNVFNPIVSLVGTGTACVGSPLSFSINGLPIQMTSYSFTPPPGPGGTALPGTTHYTLSGTINSVPPYVSCYDSDTVSVTGLPTPPVTLAVSPTVLCEGESATLTASGGLTYTWNVPGTGNVITLNPGTNNFYSVTGNGSNGCVKTATITVGVLPCTGLSNAVVLENNIRVFPNPNNGFFTVQSSVDAEIRIINIVGQEVKTLTLKKQNQTVSVGDLPDGVYFVVGVVGNSVVSKRITVVR